MTEFEEERYQNLEMSKKTRVSVSTFEKDFHTHLPPSATGKDLFDEVIATAGIGENRIYFGLHFIDSDNQDDWLDMDKKILKQRVKINDTGDGLKFQLKFRFYPEDVHVAKEVIEEVALRLLFIQVQCSFLYRSEMAKKVCLSCVNSPLGQRRNHATQDKLDF